MTLRALNIFTRDKCKPAISPKIVISMRSRYGKSPYYYGQRCCVLFVFFAKMVIEMTSLTVAQPCENFDECLSSENFQL